MKKRFLVFGAGAIGTYIGGSLLRIGQKVTFLEKQISAKKIQKTGLAMMIEGKEVILPNIDIASSLDKVLEKSSFDYGIIAIKSYDTKAFIETIKEYRSELPVIICFQNGVENESSLREVIGAKKVIAGTVTSAIGRLDVGRIVLEKRRGVGFASSNSKVNELAIIFNEANLNANVYKHEGSMKWSKLLTNLLANASSAILNMLPGEVFKNPALFKLEMCQLREAISVMKALGCQVIDLPATPVRMLAFGSKMPFGVSHSLMKNLLGKGRGEKKPSLMIDYQRGSPESEIAYLNGAVARFGEKLGIPTPVNHVLTETLTSLITDPSLSASFDHQPEKLVKKILAVS